MTTIVSNVCRVKFEGELLEWADAQKAKITKIPEELLAPRQIKLRPAWTKDELSFPSIMKWHRDAWIPTVTTATAKGLVENRDAEYCTQSALIFDRDDYLADNDVVSKPEEIQRVNDSGADKVIVGVIGENRSALAVCRDIVSGCQKEDGLHVAAARAIEAASCFLIED